jgi:DNA-binding phage protein
VDTKASRWDQIRAHRLRDPAIRRLYEERRRTFAGIRQIVEALERQRVELGMSKLDLARKAGANPAALRRLLTSEDGNPTLQTLVSLCDALGLEIVIRPRGQEAGATHTEDASRGHTAPGRPMVSAG